MLRRTMTALVVSLMLAAGLLTAAPTATAVQYDNSIGIVKVPTQKWKGKCAKYRLGWHFTPPAESDGWTVIARIRTPKGFSIRSEFFDSNSKNADGSDDLRSRLDGGLRMPLCGSSIKPGRYKVEMQMIYTVGRDTITKTRTPTYFRLVRKSR